MDQQTTDSASSASAMLTGVKTIHKTVGFDHKIELGKADSISKAEKVNSLAYHAQKAGSIYWGIMGEVDLVPKLFQYDTIVYHSDKGIYKVT